MKKIVFFIPNLVGAGAENVCVELYKKFSNIPEVQVVIIVQEDVGRLKALIREEDYLCLGTRNTIKSIYRLRGVIRKIKPSSILGFMNTPSIIVGLSCVFYPELSRIGSVHNSISEEVVRAKKTLKGRIRVLLYPIGFSLLDKLVFVSKSTLLDFESNIKLYKSNDKIVIYNPINKVENYEEVSVVRNASGFRILSVGRLHNNKNHKSLIEAVALIKESGQDVYLDIYGEGEEYKSLDAFIKKMDATDYVTLKGYSTKPFLNYANYDLFCIPSYREGFGNVIIEAMSCGLPVVTTPSGGGEEAVDTYGVVLDGYDSMSIAKGIQAIISSPDYHKYLSECSIERAMQFNSADTLAKYKNLLL